jgi:beta-phosphoglucomutase
MDYKYYLFDLDGVLLDSVNIQYNCIKEAIFKFCNYDISNDDIFKTSLTSKTKLKYLAEKKIISNEQIDIIYNIKNETANNCFDTFIQEDKNKIKIFKALKKNEKKIAVVTNNNKASSSLILKKLGLLEYVDLLITNTDVINSKPHPEPYMKSIAHFCGDIEDYVIFEDSEEGIISAEQTGCKVIKINGTHDVDLFFESLNVSSRDFCVLCEPVSNLIPIKTIKSPYHLIDNDGEYDLTYGYCENCFSVQLMTLLDPEILYDGNKLILPYSNSYNWVQHNISLIQFVVSSINISEPLLEVGSSSFVLGKHLVEYYNDYTVFDISLKTCEKINNVKYIEGNCENYQFEKGSNILMSHVFEHLYEPKKFVENCRKNGVKNIIISIPNMNNCENVFHVTNQHTYLYNDNDIEYLFSLYKYKCTKRFFFDTNDESFKCIFFNFILYDSIEIPPRIIVQNRHLYTSNLLNTTIPVQGNTFIATAGMFSSIIFQLLSNSSSIDKNEHSICIKK